MKTTDHADLTADDQQHHQRRLWDEEVNRPGKFGGQPAWVPYFWQLGLDGGADGECGRTLTFGVTNEDRALFPELDGVGRVFLTETEDGFVTATDGPDADDEEPIDDEGPAEDDLVTEDHRHFYQNGKLVLTVGEGDDAHAALREHMDRQRFWPGVWFLSDHGNAYPIDV